MKSKFKKLMAAALVLCLMLALLPAGVLADGPYSVTVDCDSNGTYTITGVDETGKAAAGAEITITVKANEGYGFESIKKDNQPQSVFVKYDRSEATHTFTMPAENVEFSVSFLPIHKVSFSDYNKGKYTVGNVTPTDLQTYDCLSLEGKEFDFSVEAKDGYYIESVGSTDAIITQDGTSGLYKFTTPAKDVLVNVNVGQYETHSISVDNTIYTHGSINVERSAYNTQEVKVYVTPDPGYKLTRLYYLPVMARAGETEISIIGSQPYTFTMPDYDIVLFAEFATTTYNITAKTPTNGKISFTVNGATATTANYRDQIVVTVDPDDGYYLKSLKVGGDEVSYWVNWNWHWYYDGTGTYTFNMPAENVEISAEFTNQLGISTTYNGYRGDVEVWVKDAETGDWAQTSYADKGDLVAFKLTAYKNYNIGDIAVTGRWSGYAYTVDYFWRNGWYYFEMPGESVDISVDFVDNSHKVYVDKATDGTLKASTEWAEDGQMVYITATPDKGYELGSLYVKTAKGDYLRVFEAQKENTYYFYMPDQYVTVSAVFVYKTAEIPFVDVSSKSWYYDAVRFVYGKGIMDGVSTYSFAPDATITRGMVVTMLWRMAGEPYAAPAGFTDVASGRYYSTAVAWAAKNGIVEGMTSTTFAPNQAITREQLASILYRYAKWLGFSGAGSDISGYTDAGKVSSYAYDAMSWAVKTGVVTGTSARVLDPQGTASRAAAAQMFMNFYNYIK